MTNNPFTVILDLDSTIYDIWTPWLEWYNLHYNDTFTTDQIHKWGVHDLVKPECGTKIYSFLHKKGLFNSLQPFPGALTAIRKVHDWGIKQIFCSVITGTTASSEKVEAIERDFPYLGARSLVLVGGDKTLCKGDVLIDDGAHNLEDFRATNRFTVLANMHNAPYCKFPDADAIMLNWKDYPEIILNLFETTQEIILNLLGTTQYD